MAQSQQPEQESQSGWLSVFALVSYLCVLLCVYWWVARGEIQLHEIKRPTFGVQARDQEAAVQRT